MQVDVALTPRDLAGRDLRGHCAVVIDVLRATTSMVTACEAGCSRIVPVDSPDNARGHAAEGVLLAGEQGGEAIAGFHLGNSPRDFTPAAVRGRTIVLTTTNGTRALLAVSAAEAVGVAALVNVDAAAEWAAATHERVTVVCAGDRGELSLEDLVCAGLLVERLIGRAPGALVTDAALAARAAGEVYGKDLDRLREDSRWARRLAARGHAADVAVCFGIDVSTQVPRRVGTAVVPGPPRVGDAAR